MKSFILTLIAGLSAPSFALDGRLGVVNKLDGTATVFNLRDGTAKTYKVGYRPHEITFSGHLAYVSNYGSEHVRSQSLTDQPGNSLTVIDLQTDRQTDVELGAARCAPHGLAAGASGKTIYITCEGRQEIAVVDTSTQKISHMIPTNQAGSHLIVVSVDEAWAYVTNFWLGTVTVLDLNQRKISAQVPVGRGVEGIGLSPDGHWLYVTRVEDGEIVKVDTQSRKVVARGQLGSDAAPIRVEVNPANQNEIFVNDSHAGTLKIIDANDFKIIRELNVGRQNIGLAQSPRGIIFSAAMKDNQVQAFDITTGELRGTIKTGHAPDGLSYQTF